MKRNTILLALLAMLILSACSSRKRGKGCDCPTFGQLRTGHIIAQHLA